MFDVTMRVTRECWRCQLELVGPDELMKVICPRCGVALDENTDEGIVDMNDRRCWQAAKDLVLIFNNWKNAYIKLLDERQQADYSLLNDFILEIIEQAFPYMHRLSQEGMIHAPGKEYVAECVNAAVGEIYTACTQWEHLQRLTGSWTDDEEEFKQHWLGKLGRIEEAVSHDLQARLTCDRAEQVGETNVENRACPPSPRMPV